MKIPSAKTVQKNIKWLEENLSKLPRVNGFGENMQKQAEADLKVLKEDLSEDDIDRRTQFEDEEDDDSKEWTAGEGRSARTTRQWLDGEEETSPIDNYKGLVGWTGPRLSPPRA